MLVYNCSFGFFTSSVAAISATSSSVSMFLIAYRFALYYNLLAMNPYREVKNGAVLQAKMNQDRANSNLVRDELPQSFNEL